MHSTGTTSTVYIANDTIASDVAGVGATTSNLIWLGNNAIAGNTINGAPSSTTPLH